jgi:ferredoxin
MKPAYSSVKLELDPAACDGFGFCAGLLGELVRLDEWGFPMIESREVPSHLLVAARHAVKACPRRALKLVGGAPR